MVFQRPGARDLAELTLVLALGLWYRAWSELALGNPACYTCYGQLLLRPGHRSAARDSVAAATVAAVF